MKPGAVLLYKDFRFDDGTIKDKLMVVVGDDVATDKTMVVLTTSQQHQKLFKDGCQSTPFETYYVFNAHLGGFKKTTWVILKPRLLATSKLANRVASGSVAVLHSLVQVDYSALKNCFKRSEDVSPYQIGLLK